MSPTTRLRTTAAVALVLTISACSSPDNRSALNGTVAQTTRPTTLPPTTVVQADMSVAAARVSTVVTALLGQKRTQEAETLRSAKEPCAQITALSAIANPSAAYGSAGELAGMARTAQAALLLTTPTASCGGLQRPSSGALSMTASADSTQEFAFEVSFPPAVFGLDKTAMVNPSSEYSFSPGAPLNMSVEGAGGTSAVGDPVRADWTTLIAVPAGSKPTVSAEPTGSVTLTGVLLSATQEQPADADLDGSPRNKAYQDRPVVVNKESYSRPAPQTTALAMLRPAGKFRGVDIYSVTVPTTKYDPTSKNLSLLSGAKVRVSFGKNSGKFSVTPGAGSQWDRATGMLSQTVSNKGAVGQWIASAATSPTLSGAVCGSEMLIVTPTALKSEAARLAASKNATGMLTKVYEMPAGTTSAQLYEKIKKSATDSCFVKLSYVILLGDIEYIPTMSYTSTWVKDAYNDGTDGVFGTDFPYTQIDGDLFPDIFLGRLPAASLAEATAMVDKTIAYQNSPTADPAFYKNTTVSGFFQYQRDSAGNVTSYTKDARGFSRTANLLSDKLGTSYTVDRLLVAEDSSADPKTYDDGSAIPAAQQKPATPWTSSGSEFIADLNAGRFFALHRDHGGVQAVGNPYMSNSDMLALTNKEKQGLLIAVDCLAGTYEASGKTGFAEAALKNSNGGAVAAIGAAEVSPSSNNNHLARGFVDAWYPSIDAASNITGQRFGEILYAGKAYVYAQAGANATTESAVTEWYLYNLLGDPSLHIYKRQPTNSKLRALVKAGVLTVELDSGATPPDTVITVWKGGVPVARGTSMTSFPRFPAGAYTVTLEAPGETSKTAPFTVS